MLQGVEVNTEDLILARGRTRGVDLRALQNSRMPSAQRSIRFGRGMEYEETRKYVDGDDIRLIDWRVTARTGTAHTKVFREDRQRAVFLVVDMTEPMRFGTRAAFKSVVAAEAAAVLSWCAHDQGDLVALVIATNSRLHHFRPASRASALHRQLKALADSSSSDSRQRECGIADAVPVIAKSARTGDLAIFISDFFELDDAGAAELKKLGQRRQLLACWIADRTELQAMPAGRYPISDGDRFSVVHLETRRGRKKYQRFVEQRERRVAQLLRDSSMSAVRLRPGDEVAHVLATECARLARTRAVLR